MKRILPIFYLLILPLYTFAQIPSGYYSSATGVGYQLKTQLYNIIKNHHDLGYGGLWTLYATNPQAFNDNWYDSADRGKILDVYSEIPTGPDAYTYLPVTNQCGNYSREGNCYNREHIIPQSVFREVTPMRTDAFHVWPTDGFVNGKRNNFPFGVVANPTWVSTNGSKLGNNLNSGYSAGYSGVVFEPIDEFKGDFARAHFYFATRYQEHGIQNWSYEMFNGTKDKVFATTFLNILINWHMNDPVSPREIALNEAIFNNQGNRNPFIDHPEFVYEIWGNNMLVAEVNKEILTDIEVIKIDSNTIRVTDKIGKNNFKNIEVYNSKGQLFKKVSNVLNQNEVNINISNKGIYLIKIETGNDVVTKKIIL